MKKKTILITGAGSGIGKASANELAKRGHDVIATAETQSQADALRVEFPELKDVFVLDIRKKEDRQKLEGMDIDVLINNAGVGESGSIGEIPMERLRNVFETNVFSAIELTQIVIKEMIKNEKGTVIFVSSVAGRLPLAFLSPYSMTKYALSGGVAALRQEMNKLNKNIHVALIEPGAYATGFNEQMMATKYQWMGQNGEHSYFEKIIDKLRKDDKRFARFQEKDTKSIVSKIVKAVEAEKPKTRYVAPLYVAMGVWIMRAIGK